MTQQPVANAQDPANEQPARRWRAIPLVVACPLFLQNLDTSIMATALPAIGRSLHVDVLRLNLAITAYLLSLAIALPACGWLADRLGPRRLFCGAVLLFSLTSALCSLASQLNQLVLFRLLQGIGGAMMVPVGRLILLRSIPQAAMLSAMVWFTLPGGVGRMAGPLFGGMIVTVASWRWIFFINVPIGLAAVALAMMLIPPDRPKSEAEPPPRFDIIGFVLLASGLVGIMGSVELAGKNVLPVAFNVALGLLGVLALVLYLRHSRLAAEPLIDLSILRFPSYRAIVMGAMPIQIALGAAPFLLPLMFQIGFGRTPMQSGLLTVAISVGALSSRTVVRRAIQWFGFRRVLVTSASLTALCYAAYGLFTPETPEAVMFAVMAVGGLTTAMAMISVNTLGYTDIPQNRLSHATTGTMLTQQVALSIGVVLGASVLTVTAWLRGRPEGAYHANDFWPAFVIVGIVTLLAVLAFRRLRGDEGSSLRGRKA
ncbi:MFS transporter [Pigmentiphaga soli]|uniref:MFS transporter n=1 Tax=Pigmentiphaga soli TaxID=1007095 RepID=A0ABP8GL76_9BURK